MKSLQPAAVRSQFPVGPHNVYMELFSLSCNADLSTRKTVIFFSPSSRSRAARIHLPHQSGKSAASVVRRHLLRATIVFVQLNFREQEEINFASFKISHSSRTLNGVIAKKK